MNKWVALALFVAVTVAAALVGSLSTLEAAAVYGELEQPSWAPPPWLFGPVWTILYAGIAVAGWLAWKEHGTKSPEVMLWGAQMAMNALWSPLFFAWGLRGLALVWILAMAAVLVAFIWRTRNNARVAAILFAPYLAWVLFASCLNASVWWLNRG